MRTGRLTSATLLIQMYPVPTPLHTISACIFAAEGGREGVSVHCEGIANDLSGGRQHILYTYCLMTSDQGPAILTQ